MDIRFYPFIRDDYTVWRSMVNDYDCDITDDRASNAWEKIFQAGTGIYAIMIFVNDIPAGFYHYNFHEFAFATGTTCYLSDLYVVPQYRRNGIARIVLNKLITRANQEHWERLYWVTEHGNSARSLYDEVAQAEFVRYHIDFK